jgi:hypothetical protein
MSHMIGPPPCLTPHWGPHTAVVGLLAAVVVVELSARTSPKSHPLYICIHMMCGEKMGEKVKDIYFMG